MINKLLLPVILLICSSIAAGQTITETKKPEKDEKLIKAAVDFLRQTSVDVDRMRSVENRISFSAELSSLMWFYDEKTARGMYASVINDFKQMLMNFDVQMNSTQFESEDEMFPGFRFVGGRSPAHRKLQIALLVRQQIALGMADHDAEMALSFFYDTAGLISNPEIRKQNEAGDKQFESQLVRQIADKDAAKAARFGKESLKEGVDGNHIELLKRIYRKDAEKGIDFGQAILSTIKSDKSKVQNVWIYSSLLSYGSENLEASKKAESKKPVYSQNDLREIADLFAQVVLDSRTDEYHFSPAEYAEQIEKFSPGRAAQIRSKYRITGIGSGGNSNAAANRMVSNTAAMALSNTAHSVANTAIADEEMRQRGIAEREKEMTEAMTSLGKSLPKEEREKIVARARTIISQTPGKEMKIAGLGMLAAQVARAGDAELADEIMKDAERLVNPLPKNYRDFLQSLALGAGYAEANPEKAFPLLESTILRANETIAAFVKVAEFIDVAEEMVSDGEVQVGAFGGSMLRGMTREIGAANTTLVSLAKADFAKTRALTEKFERLEVRVLAKMLVLRAVLDEKKPVADPSVEVGNDPSAMLSSRKTR